MPKHVHFVKNLLGYKNYLICKRHICKEKTELFLKIYQIQTNFDHRLPSWRLNIACAPVYIFSTVLSFVKSWRSTSVFPPPCPMCPALLCHGWEPLYATDSGKGVILLRHNTSTLSRQNSAEFRPHWIGLILFTKWWNIALSGRSGFNYVHTNEGWKSTNTLCNS